MVVISELFSLLGSPKSKLLILHAGAECSGSAPAVFRSLTSEHVIAEALLRTERQRPTPLGAALRRAENAGRGPDDAAVLAVMRRWFWARAADRGFAVTGFPRNLRQALVFDEWLECRSEGLDACIMDPDCGPDLVAVAAHYRDQGLLVTPTVRPETVGDA